MTIWRFELGLWRYSVPMKLKDYLEFSYDKGLCGCHILTISRFYFTFLSDECYPALKKLRKRTK